MAYRRTFGDWVYDNLGTLLIVAVLGLLGLGFYLAYASNSEHERLVEQCLDDGRKEYECESMLKKDSSTFVPVPIMVH